MSDLDAQFAFLNEADRLKSVLRATTLCDGSRRENSGEHSWHLALYAMVLADQAAPGVDINRVIRMLLLHDLVEIDVGDVPSIRRAARPIPRPICKPPRPPLRNVFLDYFPKLWGTIFIRCGRSLRPIKRLAPNSPNPWTGCSR